MVENATRYPLAWPTRLEAHARARRARCPWSSAHEGATFGAQGDTGDAAKMAEAAGVPDEDLVTGSREALEKLARKIKKLDERGSFKNPERP